MLTQEASEAKRVVRMPLLFCGMSNQPISYEKRMVGRMGEQR
jgi:hypothetical protein